MLARTSSKLLDRPTDRHTDTVRGASGPEAGSPRTLVAWLQIQEDGNLNVATLKLGVLSRPLLAACFVHMFLPKRRLTFSGLHGVISQKTQLFITTAVRCSHGGGD
jgi:hypothetical protein